MSIFGNTDNEVPGGVYLCQVNEQISCGACCGLYNVADPSLESIMEMLTHRTVTFERVPRDMDSILAFKEEIEAGESQTRPFPEFHHCPYIGLVGTKRLRVGCLLHPLADGNKGIDFRGLSFYGGMACRVYFCPTCYHLPRVFKEIVREAARDWYLYGLVITETKMLSTFFKKVERRLGQPITKEDILENEGCLEAVREFLELKLHWPFRPNPFTHLRQNSPCRSTGKKGVVTRHSLGEGGLLLRRVPPSLDTVRMPCAGAQGGFTILGNYFFGDQLYPTPSIDYEIIGEATSRYDTILRGLRSYFSSANELRRAENLLDGLIDKLASTISPNSSVFTLHSHAVL